MFRPSIISVSVLLALIAVAALVYLQKIIARPSYDQFLIDFEKRCADSRWVRKLALNERASMCECMQAHAVANWKCMDELYAALRVQDREPRGYTDYLAGAERIAFASCSRAGGLSPTNSDSKE